MKHARITLNVATHKLLNVYEFSSNGLVIINVHNKIQICVFELGYMIIQPLVYGKYLYEKMLQRP